MVQKEDILFSGSTTRRIGRLQSAVPLLASAYVSDVAGVYGWILCPNLHLPSFCLFLGGQASGIL